jgi:peptidoglycan hydrolase-like protein with peptidoglycan-binding domain
MANAPSLLKGSVGVAGQNQQPDTQLVQTLLNAVPATRGGPAPALDVDGLCGPITNGAIRKFQQMNQCLADGRIDPGKTTEKALLAVLEALGKLAAILGGSAAPAPPPPAPPVQAGPNSPVRRRFLAVVASLLPASGLTNGTKPAIGTNCGEFPGKVFGKVPVLLPNEPGAFKIKVKGAGTLFLTSPTTWWEQLAQEVDAQHAPARKCWVPFGANRPIPGDIYLLARHSNPLEFQHVGVIVSSTGSQWTTADGGQGNGGQFGFVKRTFQPNGEMQGEFGNKAWLKGWVDLDNLHAVAASAFPPNM